jgi:hypothetical protein
MRTLLALALILLVILVIVCVRVDVPPPHIDLRTVPCNPHGVVPCDGVRP